MTPLCHYPATPKKAAGKRAAIDRLLDPELFKAVGDPTRAALLACLVKCGRPCSVTEVAEACSVDFSVVARHLGSLARAGLLESRKSGRLLLYRPKCAELCDRLRQLIAAIEEWCPNLSPEPGAGRCCSQCGPPREETEADGRVAQSSPTKPPAKLRSRPRSPQ